MNPKSCIVIGAGLSGLAAAYLLAKHNWEVTVLEAQPFTNGRVYSFEFKQAPGLVCELGGEWIGRDHHAMIALCKELKLETMPHRFDFFFFERGRRSRKNLQGGHIAIFATRKSRVRKAQATERALEPSRTGDSGQKRLVDDPSRPWLQRKGSSAPGPDGQHRFWRVHPANRRIFCRRGIFRQR